MNYRRKHSRLRIGLSGALAAAASLSLVFLGNGVAQAACLPSSQGGSCFLGVDLLKSRSNSDLIADGGYVRMYTEKMDVIVQDSRGNYSVSTKKPVGGDINGFNVRAIQVLANDGATQFDSEFTAAGVTAGCGAGPTGKDPSLGCTKTNSDGGIQKAFYMDGTTCQTIFGTCDYFVEHYQDIQIDTVHTYQVQRNFLQGGLGYRYRTFFDGGAGHVAPPQFFEFGDVNVIAEKDSSWEGYDPAKYAGPYWKLRQNMATRQYDQIGYHVKGAASSNPPGKTNYIRPWGYAKFNTFGVGEAHTYQEDCDVQFAATIDFRTVGSC